MRVLVVLGTSAGGVGRHVEGLVRGLATRGHTVVVACPAAVARQFGLDGHASSVVPVEVSDRPSPVTDVAAVRRVRGLTEGADVVHAHGLRAGALVALAATRLKVPVVATLHNAAPDGTLTRAVYGALERLVARRCDLVLGVSADLVTRMRSLGARRTGLAVVAAPRPRAAARDRFDVHAELGIDPRTSLAVVVARLAPQKGLDLLLDALLGLTDLDLLTVVAGDGPLRSSLQRRIDTEHLAVRLLGARQDVPDLLSAADVVVSSARWEGQPLGLQEALHAGAAIVATDVGGSAAVLGDAAVLVPPDDATSLARALRDVVTLGPVRDDLRSRAVERAEALPTEDDAVEAALAAYAQVRVGLRP